MRLTPTASCARINRATLRSCGFQPPAFAQLGKEGETPSVASFPGAASGMWKLCRFPHLQACAVPSRIRHGRCAHDGERQPATPPLQAQRQREAAARQGRRILSAFAGRTSWPLRRESPRCRLEPRELSSRVRPWHARPARQAQPAGQRRGAGPRDGGAQQGRAAISTRSPMS